MVAIAAQIVPAGRARIPVVIKLGQYCTLVPLGLDLVIATVETAATASDGAFTMRAASVLQAHRLHDLVRCLDWSSARQRIFIECDRVRIQVLH